MPKQTRKQFSQVLADLANEKYPPSKEDLYAVSDLGGKQLQQFAAGWRGLSAARRLRILTEMGELADSHVEFNYHAIARAVLEDEDDKVRAAAIRNLWEDQSADLIAPFVKALTQDKSAEVRAAAASALGIYVYLGETEELPRAKAKAVEDTLLKIFGGADTVEVRRRALESVSFSGRSEVTAAIDAAYESGPELMRVSALHAMGRNLDGERWGPTVLNELTNGNPLLRFEAARAAGELQLEEALPPLGDLLDDDDREVQEAGIRALGELGGREAERLLERRLETADEELAELIEDALAEAEFMDGMSFLGMVDVGDDEHDEEVSRLN